MKNELAKTEVIHFIGIGGIGMSRIYLNMKDKKFKDQGSDINFNKNKKKLKKEKIKIFIKIMIVVGQLNKKILKKKLKISL